jgi:hypothetical protein
MSILEIVYKGQMSVPLSILSSIDISRLIPVVGMPPGSTPKDLRFFFPSFCVNPTENKRFADFDCAYARNFS